MLEKQLADGAVVPLGGDGVAAHRSVRASWCSILRTAVAEGRLLDEEVEGVPARPGPVLGEMGQLHQTSPALSATTSRVPLCLRSHRSPKCRPERAGHAGQGAEEAGVEEPAGTIVKHAVRTVVLATCPPEDGDWPCAQGERGRSVSWVSQAPRAA